MCEISKFNKVLVDSCGLMLNNQHHIHCEGEDFSFISNPILIVMLRIFCSVFHNRDVVVANSFWFNAHIGVGLYLFGSSHLRQAPINRRILYSVFGSFLFNFGSVLFWATCKSLLPDKPGWKALFGLASGFVLLYVGKEYVDYVDGKRKDVAS